MNESIIQETINIEKIKVGKYAFRDMQNDETLLKSIKKQKLDEPIVLDGDLNLVRGHRRFNELKRIGIKKLVTGKHFRIEEFENELDKLGSIYNSDCLQKDFTLQEKDALWQKIWEEGKKQGIFSNHSDLATHLNVAPSTVCEFFDRINFVKENGFGYEGDYPSYVRITKPFSETNGLRLKIIKLMESKQYNVGKAQRYITLLMRLPNPKAEEAIASKAGIIELEGMLNTKRLRNFEDTYIARSKRLCEAIMSILANNYINKLQDSKQIEEITRQQIECSRELLKKIQRVNEKKIDVKQSRR